MNFDKMTWKWNRLRPIALLVLLAAWIANCPATAQETSQQEKSAAQEAATKIAGAPPGINEGFLDPELNVDEFVARFELESREIYSSRTEIIKNLNLAEGQRVADIGAGTGFFSLLFASAVGETGQVYAVDISTRFLEHISKHAEQAGLKNVSPVLASSSRCNLPPAAVDVVFICDTYHHFENTIPTLESIHRALVPGGRLFVIDFDRIPGKSRPWLLDHVRANKETFQSEIESAGFRFVGEIRISSFAENYFLAFQKPDVTADAIDHPPKGDWNVPRGR